MKEAAQDGPVPAAEAQAAIEMVPPQAEALGVRPHAAMAQAAAAPPGQPNSRSLMALQRSAGNRAVCASHPPRVSRLSSGRAR
jgi:hypothetical protein